MNALRLAAFAVALGALYSALYGGVNTWHAIVATGATAVAAAAWPSDRATVGDLLGWIALATSAMVMAAVWVMWLAVMA